MDKEVTDFLFSSGLKQGSTIEAANESFRWNSIATKEL